MNPNGPQLKSLQGSFKLSHCGTKVLPNTSPCRVHVSYLTLVACVGRPVAEEVWALTLVACVGRPVAEEVWAPAPASPAGPRTLPPPFSGGSPAGTIFLPGVPG